METVTRFVDRQAGSLSVASTPGADAARTLTATASFLLSENGRKASLLSGGDGRSLQQITLQVPANRLHLVSVDKQGVARLKLRPRFELDATGIVRIDTAPVYDAPPTSKTCIAPPLRITNWRPRTTPSERPSVRSEQTTTARGGSTVAEAFMADKGMRAASHPPPTPKTCYVITDRGGVLFDVSIDQGLAKDVPAEAHRRFRADQQAYRERVRQDQIAQAALHEEKKQFITSGSVPTEPRKRRRGTRPESCPWRRPSLASATRCSRRSALGPSTCTTARSGSRSSSGSVPAQADVVVTPADVVARSAHAIMASAEEWAAIREIQERLPEAHAVLRHHLLLSRRHQGVPEHRHHRSARDPEARAVRAAPRVHRLRQAVRCRSCSGGGSQLKTVWISVVWSDVALGSEKQAEISRSLSLWSS